jgi:hypothetical protein
MTSKQLASYSAACALLLLLSLSWLGAESRIGYSAFLGLAPAAISTIYLSAVAIFLSVFLSDSG